MFLFIHLLLLPRTGVSLCLIYYLVQVWFLIPYLLSCTSVSPFLCHTVAYFMLTHSSFYTARYELGHSFQDNFTQFTYLLFLIIDSVNLINQVSQEMSLLTVYVFKMYWFKTENKVFLI